MYTPIGEKFGFLDALVVTIIAIILVFLVLSLIILISSVFSKMTINIENKKYIKPRLENKILEEDEDAVVATIVASIDYYKETKKNARVVSVVKEEE